MSTDLKLYRAQDVKTNEDAAVSYSFVLTSVYERNGHFLKCLNVGGEK